MLMCTFCTLTILLIFSSCEKEELNQKIKIEKSINKDSEIFDLQNYDPKYLGNNNSLFGDADQEIVSPSAEILQTVIDALFLQDDMFGNLNDILNTYGLPLWDYSTLDENADGVPMVSVPFYKDQEVKGVLIYSMVSGNPWLRLYAKEAVAEFIQTEYSEEIINEWFMGVSRFLLFEEAINNFFLSDFNNWVLSVTNEIFLEEDELEDRCELTITEVVWWGHRVGPDGVPIEAVTGTITITVTDCGGTSGNGFGQGGLVGSPFTGVLFNGGSNSNTNNTVNPNIKDLINLDLDLGLVNCLQNNFTDEALIALNNMFVNNSLINECDPSASNESTIESLLTTLCNSANSNSGSGEGHGGEEGEGGVDGEIDLGLDENIGNIIDLLTLQTILENDDCLGFPISCNSFAIEYVGSEFVSRIKNYKLDLYCTGDQTTNPPIDPIQFDCELNLEFQMTSFYVNLGDYHFEIDPGIFSQSAAKAINNSTNIVLTQLYSLEPEDFAQYNCNDIKLMYTDILNSEFRSIAWDLLRDDGALFGFAHVPPEVLSAQVGFNSNNNVTPTLPIADWEGDDNCLEE